MNKHEENKDFKPVRPGTDFGKRRARARPKGRQVEPEALKEIRKLLGSAPRRRDLLIEYLHLVQDSYGHISARHLAALAYDLRLPMAEVYEVATFYHHFDVVKEGDAVPAEITIRVCDSLSCALAGAEPLIAALKAKAPGYVRVVHAPCMGRCDCAPAAAVGKNYVDRAETGMLLKLAKNRAIKAEAPSSVSLADYVKARGYETIAALHNGEKTAEAVIETLSEAGLRGLGGAGFPSGKKWQFVLAGAAPRYLCINGDEGEPGTFKDKHYLESNPHQFLEGVLIAAWGVGAAEAYIYLRDEYPAARDILRREIATLEREGIAPRGYIHLRRGAGAYICGEESAMIESIEGKRGFPRHRPPYVAQVGLFGRPTLVHNVETVYWMPEILRKGAAWFAEQGKTGHKGLRSYSVSGRVKRPGVVVAPAGSTANELVALCGGMAEGHGFKAYLPGGASGGILPSTMADLPLDFGQLEKYGCFVGSHAVVILSDKDDMRAVALNLLKFFADESCGQCTPCRVGCEKAVKLMAAADWDTSLLSELSQVMADASICGLGQAAPNPIRAVMKFFPEDLRR
jgi:formate dehydrogenase beta subunit